MRSKVTSPPILAHFSADTLTLITSDASAKAIGAVLSHNTPGVERPVVYASRALSPKERTYSATKQEALASI